MPTARVGYCPTGTPAMEERVGAVKDRLLQAVVWNGAHVLRHLFRLQSIAVTASALAPMNSTATQKTTRILFQESCVSEFLCDAISQLCLLHFYYHSSL